MSNYIRGIVWQLNLPPTVKYVAVRLAEYADDRGGSVFPSIDRLARETGLHERTVQRSVAELKRRRVITVEEAHGSHRATRYRFPVITAASPQPAPVRVAESHPTGDPVPHLGWQRITRSVSDPPSDPSSSARARATAPADVPPKDDHDDGERGEPDPVDRASRAVKGLLGRATGGTIRNEIAWLIRNRAQPEWFEEVAERSETQGARAPWPYLRGVVDHWREHGYHCACKRPAGVGA